MASSVIQATETVEFEDGLRTGNYLKAKLACRVSAIYLGFNQGQCAHPGSSGVRLNSNLAVSAWQLSVEPHAWFDSQQLLC